MRRLALLGLLAVTGLTGPVTAQAATLPPNSPAATLAPLPRGTMKVFATVPEPGNPALPFVLGSDIFEGTYTTEALGNSGHSHVFEYNLAGKLINNWTIADQPDAPYGVQVANADAAGDLVVMDDSSGHIWLMNPVTGVRTLYSTIPDIPLCTDAGASSECSQALLEETPEADYAAWGPDGSLYVTDYQQAVIWRVPPHGGTPSIWLGGPALDGEIFGTAGLVMEPDHKTMLFDQASNIGGTSDPVTGKLYSVQILPDGEPGPMTELWQSGAATLPDGFVQAVSGDIYMAQIGPVGNDVIELSKTGRLLGTFGQPITGTNGTAIPFDEPSGLAYDGSDLIVANQSALAGDSAHMALLLIGTGEQAQPVYVPADAGPLAPVKAVKTKKKPVKRKARPVRRKRK